MTSNSSGRHERGFERRTVENGTSCAVSEAKKIRERKTHDIDKVLSDLGP